MLSAINRPWQAFCDILVTTEQRTHWGQSAVERLSLSQSLNFVLRTAMASAVTTSLVPTNITCVIIFIANCKHYIILIPFKIKIIAHVMIAGDYFYSVRNK